MKKLALLLSFSASIFLSGCATTKGYEQGLNSWVGASETQLVRSWGVPAQVFNTGGNKYFVYNSSRNVYLPGTSPTYTTTLYGNTVYTTSYGGSAPQNLNFQCKTTFEISHKKVRSWRYNGNDCKAPEQNIKTNKAMTKDIKTDSVADVMRKNKQYQDNLNLNTKEKQKWFTDLVNKLLSGKINKKTFVQEGLKRYPTHKKELTYLSNHIDISFKSP